MLQALLRLPWVSGGALAAEGLRDDAGLREKPPALACRNPRSVTGRRLLCHLRCRSFLPMGKRRAGEGRPARPPALNGLSL